MLPKYLQFTLVGQSFSGLVNAPHACTSAVHATRKVQPIHTPKLTCVYIYFLAINHSLHHSKAYMTEADKSDSKTWFCTH